MAFAMWNTLYCGLAVYAMYSVFFPRVWPTVLASGARHPHAARRILGMVCFDNLVATPLLCLPTLYLCKQACDGGPPSVRCAGFAAEAMRRYASEARETIGLSLALWVPIHCVTFSIIPVELRAHFTTSCSFVTITCMSVLQSGLAARAAQRGNAKAE